MMMSHQKAIRADRWPANQFFADRTPSLFRPQAHGLVTVPCLLNLQRHSTLVAAADMNRQRHLDGEEIILLKEGLGLYDFLNRFKWGIFKEMPIEKRPILIKDVLKIRYRPAVYFRSAAVRQRPVSDLTSNSSSASAGDNIPARRAGATHTHSACFHSKDRDDGVSNNNRRTNTANNRNSRRV